MDRKINEDQKKKKSQCFLFLPQLQRFSTHLAGRGSYRTLAPAWLDGQRPLLMKWKLPAKEVKWDINIMAKTKHRVRTWRIYFCNTLLFQGEDIISNSLFTNIQMCRHEQRSQYLHGET